MKQRISYLIKLFLAFLLFFVLQKIVFVYLNEPLPAGDLFQVIVHGLGLDASTTGYLLIFPFLVVWLSIWMRRMKTKAVLRPYFILIAILLSLICVADTSLYTFWKFKLDATIFNYMDAPKQAMASVSTGYVVMRLLWITVFSVLLSWTCIRLTPIPCFAHQSENAASQFHIRTIRRPYLFGHTGRGRTFHHEYRQRLFQ